MHRQVHILMVAPEKPEVSRRIRPSSGTISRSRDIARPDCSFRAVDTYFIDEVRSAPPRPFAAADGVFPQIIQIILRPGRIISKPTKEPDNSGYILNGRKTSRTGDVGRGRHIQGAEIAILIGQVRTAL